MSKQNNLIGIVRKYPILRLIKPPDPSLNYNKRYIKKLVANTAKDGAIIIDVGSGGRKFTSESISLDLNSYPGVDVVADAGKLPFKDDLADLVILSAVLEHVPNPYWVVSEVLRTLKRGGSVYVEIPFLQAYHADPADFQRYTINGLKNIFSDFRILEAGVCVGPFSAVAFFLRKFPTIFFKNAYIAKSIEVIVGWLTFWIKYFDWLLIKVKRLHVVASGVYLLATKGKLES